MLWYSPQPQSVVLCSNGLSEWWYQCINDQTRFVSTVHNQQQCYQLMLWSYRWTPLAHVTELSTSTHNIILFNIQAWRFHFNFLYLLYQYVWRRKNDILSTLHMIGDQMQSKNWVNNIKNINTDSLIMWR